MSGGIVCTCGRTPGKSHYFDCPADGFESAAPRLSVGLRELFEAAGYSVSAEGSSWRVEIAAQPRWVELVRRYWLTGNVKSDSVTGLQVQLIDQQTDDELWLPAEREHVATLAPPLVDVAALRQLARELEDPRHQRPGMQRRRLWAQCIDRAIGDAS